MLTWNKIKLIFSKEIYILISEYDVAHRINNRKVLTDVLVEMRMTSCENPDCEVSYEKYWMIPKSILYNTHYFCSDYCCYLGEDEIRYYWRKMRRNSLHV